MFANTCRKMTSSPTENAGEAESSPPRAIVAGHAGFAEGLVSAVQQIAGAGHLFTAVSNSGLGPEDIERSFRDAAAAADIHVFFTDLPGGSATFAVRRMMRTDSSIVLVTGTNLAALLEFAFHAELSARDAAALAAEKGRGALVSHGGT